jgi:branched-chain amino acid transport system permease protein
VGTYLIPSELKLAVALILIIIILVVRPSGLFGAAMAKRV